MNPETPPAAANFQEPGTRTVARPLVPVTLALMAGIAAPAWGVHFPDTWLAVGLLLIWLVLGVLWWARRPVFLLPLAFLWLLGVGFNQQAQQPKFPPDHLVHLPQDQKITILGHLQRPGKLGAERVQLFLAAEAWRSPTGWRPATGNLLVVVPPVEPPPVGTRLVVQGGLRTPRLLQNPGAFDRPRHLAADRIFREMRLHDRGNLIFCVSPEDYPLGEKLRGGIRQLLQGLDPAGRAIYLSMLLGDQGEITPEMRQNFARTGTSHLLVINGLHLGMVAAVTYFLAFWLLRCWAWLLLRVNVVKVATLLAVFPVVAYAWVAGGSPSTERAEVMVLAYLLLVFLGRPREVWSALALAALVILCLSPLRLFAISFQLSFAAVAGLIYLVPRLVRGAPWGERDESPGMLTRIWVRGKEWLAVSVVATLATAPLVAAYFQVVSVMGILVNLVAIPLVLGLALPLGEAAVLAQACSLTPVAQALLALGKLPLWLGYQAIQVGARVPGSAIIVPTPTWLQIAAYYSLLGLLLAPRRNYLTWSGAALAGVVLLASVAAPLGHHPQVLEVTCLDTYGGLEGVVVTPENRRLAVTAPGWSWPGRSGGGFGPLPGYCHWRQFRRLDLVLAPILSQDNAGELLTLAQQFTVGAFWYGRRGREGPASWDLGNFLGDRRAPPRSLARGRPPASLGSVGLEYIPLGEDMALQLTYQSCRVLIFPPARELTDRELPVTVAGPVQLLVLPAGLARELLLRRLSPERLIIYGSPPGRPLPDDPPASIPCAFTSEGAVTVRLSPGGATVKQWQPWGGKL